MFQENFKQRFFYPIPDGFLCLQRRQRGSILIWSLFLSLITSVAAISVLKQANQQLSLVSHFQQRNNQDIQYERFSLEIESLFHNLLIDRGGIPNQYQYCFWSVNQVFQACSDQEIHAVFSSPELYSNVWLIEARRLQTQDPYMRYLGKSISSIYDVSSAQKFLIQADISFRDSSSKVFKWSQGYEVVDARSLL